MSDSSGNDQVRVDTPQLKGAAEGFAGIAGRLKALVEQFSEDSRGLGEPWGDDAAGKKFFGQYAQPHEDGVSAGEGAGSALSGAAGQLLDLAAVLAAVEEQSVAAGKRLVQPGDSA